MTGSTVGGRRGPPLPRAVYRRRRRNAVAAIRHLLGHGRPLLVLGRGAEDQVTTLEPSAGRRRQDPWFDWLTGCHEADAALLVDPRRGATLFLEPGDLRRLVWDGPRLQPGSDSRTLFGVEVCLPLQDLPRMLERAIARAKGRLALLAGPRADDHQSGLAQAWRRRLTGVDRADVRPALIPLRQIKDAHEIDRHRRAVAVTAAGLRRTLPLIPRMKRESEVVAELARHYLAPANDALAFVSIVGSGVRGATLHYPHADRPLERRRPVLIDSGATCDGYCADVTRTVPQHGRFSDRRFREVYELVLHANRLGRRHARPGITLAELNAIAWQPILDAGFEHLHNLSHFIGLEVHDVGDRTLPLAPGMLISNEPGIYLPKEGFGIRIEDDLLITADGCEELTRAIPKTVAAIERVMER